MIQITISDGNPVQVTVEHRPNERRNSTIGKAAEVCAEALRELIKVQDGVNSDEVGQSLANILAKQHCQSAPPDAGAPPPAETESESTESKPASDETSAPLPEAPPAPATDGIEGTDGPVGSDGVETPISSGESGAAPDGVAGEAGSAPESGDPAAAE